MLLSSRRKLLEQASGGETFHLPGLAHTVEPVPSHLASTALVGVLQATECSTRFIQQDSEKAERQTQCNTSSFRTAETPTHHNTNEGK